MNSKCWHILISLKIAIENVKIDDWWEKYKIYKTYHLTEEDGTSRKDVFNVKSKGNILSNMGSSVSRIFELRDCFPKSPKEGQGETDVTGISR